MNCWEVLGIEPTRDRAVIDDAFERQQKFASEEDARLLESAYRQALAGTGHEDVQKSTQVVPGAQVPDPTVDTKQADSAAESEQRPLSAEDHQIVRETVIQVRAMLNDSSRSSEAQVWRAILTEPPADQADIRQRIGEALAPEVRPLAENGAFPADVVHFLGDWFGWNSVFDNEPSRRLSEDKAPAKEQDEEDPDAKSQLVSFWPAVVGWIVVLAVLASLFGGIGGGG